MSCRTSLLALALVLEIGCTHPSKPDMIVLENTRHTQVQLIPYGAIVTSIRVADRNGNLDDIVLGYDTAADYAQNNGPYMGAIVGRYANRIAKGMFTLDGVTYQLATNNGPNHLHGGNKGFDKVVWQFERTKNADGEAAIFRYRSPDGEEGYPGNLDAQVTYTLTDRNELIIDYLAKSDKATPLNLSHHSYFNLTGVTRDVLDHELTIDADRYTPIDSTSIPTGELAPVEGTPFDFRKPEKIGSRIMDDNEQLRNGNGYDHNFVINRQGEGLVHAARVVEPSTGRVLDVFTTEPGVQFYSGNFLDGSIRGKFGKAYARRFGFCLETQHYPDSPNKPQFPSTILRPGTEFRSRTIYAFSVRS